MAIFDWIIVVTYFVVLLGIGIKTSKIVKNMDDFSVAGGKIIWPSIFATLAASIIGGGASIGTAGAVFTNGYVFLFTVLGFSVQFILLGIFVAPRIRQYEKAQTIGDIMEIHFGKVAKLMSGVLSFCFCAGILGSQALALGTVINSVTEIPITTAIVVGIGFVILYSTFGGLMTVVQTDVFQFLILGIILPLILMIGLFKLGGPAVLIETIPDAHFTFLGAFSLAAFISLFLTFLLGEALAPPFVQRVFAAKNSNASKKAYIATGIFLIGVLFVTATIGLVALGLYPDIQPDQALPFLIKTILPVGITGLGIAALMAVIISTSDSYLNATTTVFIRDIYTSFINPNTSGRNLLKIGRIVNVAVGILAIVFALKVPSIIDALVYAYSLWAPIILPPLVFAIMTRRINKYLGVVSMLVGGITTAIWIWGLGEPFGITGLMAGIIANILSIIIVSICTSNTKYQEISKESVL